MTRSRAAEAEADSDGERVGNLIAAGLVLLAAAVELGLREAFYHVSSEVPGLLLVCLLLLFIALTGLRARGVHQGRGGRAMLVVALAAWVWVCDIRWPGGPSVTIGLLLLCSLGAWCLRDQRWAQVRRSLTAAAIIFILSQPVVAAWRARDVSWPDPAPAAEPGTLAPASMKVVLLLDELNAESAGPIAAAMERSGRPVYRRAVAPVGDGTAKVVPSLLSRQVFHEAKPCGWHTVCSGSAVLSLGRVHASRPDIDIVGFYFPYCAVQGLRSCDVLSPAQPHLDLERWRCAAQRRSDWLARRDGIEGRLRCATLNGEVWATLAADVEAAIWRAPFWQRGGLLYAHVPLPHPPGEGGAGTLEEHYRMNIHKAAKLVAAITDRLVRQGLAYQLVVFSDHPLRRAHWCRSTQYRDACSSAPEHDDESVPLLATGWVSPRFDEVESNMDIFALVVPERFQTGLPAGASAPTKDR